MTVEGDQPSECAGKEVGAVVNSFDDRVARVGIYVTEHDRQSNQ
jgi:hypothetical protein